MNTKLDEMREELNELARKMTRKYLETKLLNFTLATVVYNLDLTLSKDNKRVMLVLSQWTEDDWRGRGMMLTNQKILDVSDLDVPERDAILEMTRLQDAELTNFNEIKRHLVAKKEKSLKINAHYKS